MGQDGKANGTQPLAVPELDEQTKQKAKKALSRRTKQAIRESAEHVGASDTHPERRLRWSTLKRAVALAEIPLGPSIGLVVVAMLLAGSALALPLLEQWAIDQGITEQDYGIVVKACLALIGLAIFQLLAGGAQGIIANRLGQDAMDNLRRKVFAHMQRLSMGFYEKREPGKIIARVTSDIDAINELLRMILTGLFSDFLKGIGISIIMFAVSWKLALLIHATLPPILVLMWVFRRYSERVFRRVRESLAGISSYLHETVTGIRVIKAFSRERVSAGVFSELTEDYAQSAVNQVRLFAFLFPSIQLLHAVALVIVFWYGGVLAAQGAMTLGAIWAFVRYSLMLFDPWRALADFAASTQRAGVALDRIMEVMDEDPQVQDAPDATEMPPISERVRLENVDFSYDGKTSVLKDVSLEAEIGQVIALVGPTGAGKSTIVKLVARLYDVSDGRITFDGTDIRDATVKSVREQIGMVPQDAFLFAGTLRENIAYGNPGASDEEIEAAAKAARITEFSDHLPEGLETSIHERGVKLSDGQRQLVSLARAIAADTKVLILDEATSSVDLFTEEAVQEALEEARPGRITFVIAHRLATVRSADQILIIDDGRIMEQGTHDELMQKSSRYRSMYLRRFDDMTEEERRSTELQAADVQAGA
jgi:ABC-type multidrug transport system fused ATPase/permease subunit